MSIPCEICGSNLEFSNYELHIESHKCDNCGDYVNPNEHKCSNDVLGRLSRFINEIKEEYEQKANSLEMFMKNEKDLAEEMREAGFSIEYDFTFVNNKLFALTEKCENFILNFKKEEEDKKEDKEKDEKTKLEVIDLEKFNFIQECSESECNICEEQTEKKYVCTECKCAQEMCVDCLESLIRNRYYMSGGDTYISCMTCKTKLEF